MANEDTFQPKDFKMFVPFDVDFRKDAKGEEICVVKGYASTTALDSDGERITFDAIKKGIDGWSEFMNLREMHSNKAAGIGMAVEYDEKGAIVECEVVDSESIKKVRKKVLKGYSIGGKKLSKKGDVITGIEVTEISLVDRPANPECMFDMVKAMGLSKPEEKKALKKRSYNDLKKSLYSVSGLLQAMDILCACGYQLEAEEAFEGEAPAYLPKLKELKGGLADLIREALDHELTELTAETSPSDAEVEEGAKPKDLKKRGAKYSAADVEAFKGIHGTLNQAISKIAEMVGIPVEAIVKAEGSMDMEACKSAHDGITKAHKAMGESMEAHKGDFEKYGKAIGEHHKDMATHLDAMHKAFEAKDEAKPEDKKPEDKPEDKDAAQKPEDLQKLEALGAGALAKRVQELALENEGLKKTPEAPKGALAAIPGAKPVAVAKSEDKGGEAVTEMQKLEEKVKELVKRQKDGDGDATVELILLGRQLPGLSALVASQSN